MTIPLAPAASADAGDRAEVLGILDLVERDDQRRRRRSAAPRGRRTGRGRRRRTRPWWASLPARWVSQSPSAGSQQHAVQPRLLGRARGGPDALDLAPPGAQRLEDRVAAVEVLDLLALALRAARLMRRRGARAARRLRATRHRLAAPGRAGLGPVAVARRLGLARTGLLVAAALAATAARPTATAARAAAARVGPTPPAHAGTSSAPPGPSRTVQPASRSASRSRSASAQSLASRAALRAASSASAASSGPSPASSPAREIGQAEDVEHLDEVVAAHVLAPVGLADPRGQRRQRARGVEVVGQRGEEGVTVLAQLRRRRPVDQAPRGLADPRQPRPAPSSSVSSAKTIGWR